MTTGDIGHFGPLPDGYGKEPMKGATFLDVEVHGSISAGGTITGGTIVGGTITGGTITGTDIVGGTVTGGTIVGGDMYSDNWNGAIPPSLATRDTTIGLVGYALDGSTGGAQFVNIFADAGELRDLDILGTLTILSGGILRTDDSGPRWEWDQDANGATDMRIFSDLTNEYAEGYMNSVASGTGADDWAVIEFRSPALGDVTNRGLGVFSAESDYANTHGGATVSTSGYGTWDAITDLGAVALGSGDATINISAVSGSGTAKVIVSAPDGVTFGSGTELLSFAGTSSLPGRAFDGDPDTGTYRIGANNIGWATGGGLRMDLSSAHLRLAASVQYEAEPATTGTAANATWILTGGTVYNLRRNTSSRKYKTDIDYDMDRLADIVLSPTHHWRTDDEQWRYSLISEDLADQDPLLVDGETPNNNAIIAVMAAKINRLERKLDDLTV